MSTQEIAPLRDIPVVAFGDAENGELRQIPLCDLIPSPTNPRTHFDPTGIAELADSIAANGLIEPIVARSLPDGKLFEVVVGGRRLRAFWNLREREDASISPGTPVPCIVRELDDAAVLRIQIVENLQRADIDALDEAHGFKRLLELGTGDERARVRAIAAQVGKQGVSVSYIYQRLKLCELQPVAIEALRAGKITTSHATDCARLTPEQQKEYIQTCKEWAGRNGDITSVRQMRTWIVEHVRTDLTHAPFGLKDPALHPDAGPCIGCPKMTATNPELLADLADDMAAVRGERKAKGKNVSDRPAAVCLDPACYHAKVQTFVHVRIGELQQQHEGAEVVKVWGGDYWRRPTNGPLSKLPTEREYHTAKSGTECAHAELAIVAGADDRAGVGKELWICRSQKCSTHHPAGHGGSVYRRSAAELAAERKKRIALECERGARAECLRQTIAAAVAAKHGKVPIEDLRVMAGSFVDRLSHDVRVALGKAMQIEPLKDTKAPHSPASYNYAIKKTFPELTRGKLLQLLLCCALAGDLYVWAYGGGEQKHTQYLAHTAKRYGVDLDAIRADLTAAAAAKQAAKKKPKAKAAKGGR